MALADVLGGVRVRRLFASGRRAHAYLFVGPAGSGRRTAAAAWAHALLCPRAGADGQPCGTCPDCAALLAGSHPDLHVLGGHRLDAARAVLAAAALRPVRARWTVLLLPDVDALTPEAAAALLKAVEEPAAATVFLLTASSPGRVPDTIVSRCQVVSLLPEATAALAAWLQARGVAADVAPALAEAADGRPGRALVLAEDPEWQARRAAADDWLAGPGTSLGHALSRAEAVAEATDLGSVQAVLLQRARRAARERDAAGVCAAAAALRASLRAEAALAAHVGVRLTWEIMGFRLRQIEAVGYNLRIRRPSGTSPEVPRAQGPEPPGV